MDEKLYTHVEYCSNIGELIKFLDTITPNQIITIQYVKNA